MMKPRFRAVVAHTATAWIVLLLSLVVTGLGFQAIDAAVFRRAEERFDFESKELAETIEKRMLDYEIALRSGVGLFNASETVTRAKWRLFAGELQLQRFFPGIQGLGFSLMITPAEREAHLARIRAEGFPSYYIRPDGIRDIYSSIIYLEPFDWRNQRAFGYDMFSEPVRRAAMERARDTGEPATSGRVTLVQETNQDVQYGVLMYMPVYHKGWPIDTVEGRRAALEGFVYSPFRMRDLMGGMFHATPQHDFSFELYDGDSPSPETLLHCSTKARTGLYRAAGHHPEFSHLNAVAIAGRTWTVYSYSHPGFISRAERLQPLGVAMGGALINVLLFFVLRQLAREQAMEARSRLSAIVDASPDAIVGVNLSGIIMSWNSGAEKIFGYTADEIVGKSNAMVLLPDLLEEEKRLLAQVAKGRAVSQHESQRRCKDGTIIDVAVTFSPVRDAQGEVVGAAKITRDITERNRLLRQLKLASYSTSASSNAVYWMRPDARIDRVNQAACDMLGYTEEELCALSIPDIDPMTTYQVWKQLFAKLKQDGGLTAEVQHRTKDGRLLPVAITANYVVTDGEEYSFAVVRDLTTEKELQRTLQVAKEEAESASLAKSRFLATMSHELRTPLNGVLGMAQMLQQDEVGDEDRKRWAQTIQNSGQTLLTLLNDVLDLSKVEAGKLELSRRAFSPATLLEETSTLYMSTAQRKRIALMAQWEGPPRACYQGDPLRLGQMLGNLVSNALKFTETGSIRIVAREGDPSGSKAVLRFSVTDTGIGISASQQRVLFRPFSQVDGSDTRRFGGTGLGLYIVRSLAAMMQGEAGVESEVGRGSTFWFQVALEPAEAEEQGQRPVVEASSPLPVSLPSSTSAVLVVDDEPTNRLVMQALLRKLNVSATCVEDGARAVEVMQSGPTVSLIFMDVQMPVMGGLEATATIRRLQTERRQLRVPIVALTAGVFQEDRDRCLNAGMDDFLPKPVHLKELEAVLRRWLGASTR